MDTRNRSGAMARRALVALAVGANLAWTRPSEAHDPQAPTAAATAPAPPASSVASSRWYGWQIAIFDATSVALTALFSAVPQDKPVLLAAAGLTYIAGGPAVHFAHDRWGTALASAGLRLALPVLGFVIGAAVARTSDEPPPCDGCDRGWSQVGFSLGGAVVGVGAASLIDIALLAHETVLVDTKSSGAPRPRPPVVRPTLAFVPDGGVVGCGGAF